MKLELIENNPSEIKNKKPFLFIHGMFHGAWCFEDNFLPFLEQKGYKAYALSLSNHGKSDRRKNLNLLTISQYVKDVEEAIDRIGTEPILVGHSMGGFVVQKYLETHTHSLAILMASVPPYGIWGITLRVLKNYPLTFLKINTSLNLKHLITNKKRFKNLMFSQEANFATLEKHYKRIEGESYAAYLGMLGFNLVNPKKINTKLIIMGGTKDKALILKDLHRTAEIYNTKAIIFDDVPHDLMLDKQWQKVIEKIITFAQ